MNRTDLDKYLEESRGLERDYLDELVRARRAAWRVAGLAMVLVVVALGALVALLPLKRVEPFVVRVDNATGMAEVVSVVREQPESYGEVVDKYWLNKYVLSRESYDWQTVQSTYDTALLLSSEPVQHEVEAMFDGPQARQTVLGPRTSYVVKVRSITPTKDTAVVRFLRTRHMEGTEDVLESLVATIGFQYVAAPMKEEYRLVNPLGFQVTSYRIDPENVGG